MSGLEDELILAGFHQPELVCRPQEHTAAPDHRREIFRRGGQYVVCQVMNWREGPPPKYLVCNPLSGHGAGALFLAQQGMGTWMEADVYDIAHELNGRPHG